jgi:hypothetical protein
MENVEIMEIEFNYINENRPFQQLLNNKFGENKIIPVSRVFNGRAVAKFYCSECHGIFWNKLGFLINKNPNHYCINLEVQVNKGKLGRKPRTSKVTFEMKQTMLRLHNQKVSNFEISKELGVSKETVKYHLKRLRGN